MQQKKWLDEKNKIPTNKLTYPPAKKTSYINIEKYIYIYYIYLRCFNERY